MKQLLIVLLLMCGLMPTQAAVVNIGDATASECGWSNTLTTYQNFTVKWSTEKNNGSYTADHFVEVWSPSPTFTGTLLYEEINIPNGRYTVAADVFTNAGLTIGLVAGNKEVTKKATSALFQHMTVTKVDVLDGRITFGIDVISPATWVGIANVKLTRTSDTVSDTICFDQSGVTTYFAPVNATLPEGISVYTVGEMDGDGLHLTPQGNEVVAGVAYILRGEAGKKYPYDGKVATAADNDVVVHCTTHGEWVDAGGYVYQDGRLVRLDGYSLVGARSIWFALDTEAAEVELVFDEKEPEEPIQLYEYVVDDEIFLSGEGVGVENPDEPVKEGFTFVSWMYESIADEISVRNVYTAVFERNVYTVTFVYSEDEATTLEVPFEDEITLPELENESWSWKWQTEEGLVDAPEVMPATDVTLVLVIPTVINRVVAAWHMDGIYTIDGMRVNAVRGRGLYIINGKKVLVK